MSEPQYDQSDADLYHLSEELRVMRRERDAWEETSRGLAGDVRFWRDLVHQVAIQLGPEVYIADDGSEHSSPVYLKVPELVADLIVPKCEHCKKPLKIPAECDSCYMNREEERRTR